MKKLSEASSREILARIDELDREFFEAKPENRPMVAEAIAILIRAHKEAVKRENTPFVLIDTKLVRK
jgi:ATP-dependent exoDNAse (exonuclease V) beta subunit